MKLFFIYYISFFLLVACGNSGFLGPEPNILQVGQVTSARVVQHADWGKPGKVEYVVADENGQSITLTQPAEGFVFYPGDKVLIQTSGSFQRIVPYNNADTFRE